MVGMKPLLRTLPCVLALAAAAPAHADFYSLDGRFACLGRGDAVCYDATPSRHVTPPAPLLLPLAIAPEAVPAKPAAVAAPVPPPVDPIAAIAARIKASQADNGDLAILRRAAAAGDRRALELVAWCALRGIGTGRDPIQAYYLYGEAAGRAVPHARDNQALIFERWLTQDQRQQVLELEATAASTVGPSALLSAGDGDGMVNNVP